ncbi:MAG TPA: type 4a pilus biogenesis protein PilO [Tepidisphaeraceae bacterium]|nr:type 4a pilus biogenesis protein PilO [Tepidisphaeraceae bacterium]
MKFGIREVIFVVVMLGLLGSTNYFVFSKANKRKAERLTDIRARQQALSNLQQATAGIEDLNRKIDDLQKAITFFEGKLPQEKEVDKILKEVWQMAEANSLQTKSIKTMRSERGPNYSEQPIDMNLSGDFNGFYSFLLQLEKLPRITRVTQMNLTKINDRDGEMQASMRLSIYFEPDSGGTSVAGAQ